MQNTLKISPSRRSSVIVVDDFYEDPLSIRKRALELTFYRDENFVHGQRTLERFATPELREVFSTIIGQKIARWDEHAMNGVFQICMATDPIVYHADAQRWAAMIFLTPDAPLGAGTSFFQHRETNALDMRNADPKQIFSGGFFDGTKFRLADQVANVFNRLVIFDARRIHAASGYFGSADSDARLFQMFFFD